MLGLKRKKPSVSSVLNVSNCWYVMFETQETVGMFGLKRKKRSLSSVLNSRNCWYVWFET